MLLKIILFIIILIIVINLYIRYKFKFWRHQPVFHLYDLHHWIFNDKIINNSPPTINKFINLLNIKTKQYKDLDKEEITNITNFIKTNYLQKKNITYSPNISDIASYIDTKTFPSYISTYTIPKLLNITKSFPIDSEKKTEIIPHSKIKGVITSKPLHITFNQKPFIIYYVDNLCVHSNNRKQGIAPELIQTHYYHLQKYNNVKVCLFKREGDLTAIVPLTVYTTYGYNISQIPTLHFNRNNINIIQLKKHNIQILIKFLKNMKTKFKCIIELGLESLLSLISSDKLIFYAIIQNNILYSLYVFRNTPIYIHRKKTSECILTLNNCPFKDMFVKGFSQAIHKFAHDYSISNIYLETTSHSNIIYDFLQNLNIKPISLSPTAFFLYNYAKLSTKPQDCFILY